MTIIIKKPGNYKICSNIMVKKKGIGIFIKSDHVSIDLGMYSIIGRKSGIAILVKGGNIRIENGMISKVKTAIKVSDSSSLFLSNLSVSMSHNFISGKCKGMITMENQKMTDIDTLINLSMYKELFMTNITASNLRLFHVAATAESLTVKNVQLKLSSTSSGLFPPSVCAPTCTPLQQIITNLIFTNFTVFASLDDAHSIWEFPYGSYNDKFENCNFYLEKGFSIFRIFGNQTANDSVKRSIIIKNTSFTGSPGYFVFIDGNSSSDRILMLENNFTGTPSVSSIKISNYNAPNTFLAESNTFNGREKGIVIISSSGISLSCNMFSGFYVAFLSESSQVFLSVNTFTNNINAIMISGDYSMVSGDSNVLSANVNDSNVKLVPALVIP